MHRVGLLLYRRNLYLNLLTLKNFITYVIHGEYERFTFRTVHKYKWFTSEQKHSSRFIQSRLDIFVLNTLQEFVTMKKILTTISTNHSFVTSFSKEKSCSRGEGISKFYSYLTKDQNYITEIKKLTLNLRTANRSLLNRHLKWELLNYEVTTFTITYTQHIAKEKRQQRPNQLKILEKKSG